MSPATDTLVDRLNMLGLRCNEAATDKLSSATAALSCFPMYMVANLHAWTGDRQFHLPVVDIPGSEQILESFAIGKQEAQLEITRDHRAVLGSLLSAAKPSDRVIYEYALETLRGFLDTATPDVVLATRLAIAQMIVAVAKAAGKGPLGSGRKVTDEERLCINHIADMLGLRQTEAANDMLLTLDDY